MKTIGTHTASFLSQRDLQVSIRTLVRYLALLVAVVAVFAVMFHVIMLYAEGQRHSWVTGVYWTLTVMTTLGFGDITFASDIGRVFSSVVLVTGIILFLILLPFLFIRFFYAPWVEEQIRRRTQAPRAAPAGTRGHVVIARYDTIAERLVERLRVQDVPFYILEPNTEAAQRLHAQRVPVIAGEIDSRATYDAVRAADAALVLANADDTTNTNIALTVREISTRVPIASIVTSEDSIDILELSGSTYVLPLKRELGEHLANRVNAGPFRAHVIGRYRNLQIAEFAAHNTPLAGRTIRESQLRSATGVSIIGVWSRGRLSPVGPRTRLTNESVPVIVGTEEQIQRLNELLAIYDVSDGPVLVIGGGRVGLAAARALRRQQIRVHMVERNEALRETIGDVPDRLVIGDAADRNVLSRAGLEEAPSVILTTHDDAMNIYIAVYCRKLNPDLRIISRITHERNIEAVHRAGADLVLSYDSLGVETVVAILQRRELTVVGGSFHLFSVPLPPALDGRTLAEGGIGARTGMTVVAIQRNGRVITNPSPDHRLDAGSELVMIGDAEQRARFVEAFG